MALIFFCCLKRGGSAHESTSQRAARSTTNEERGGKRTAKLKLRESRDVSERDRWFRLMSACPQCYSASTPTRRVVARCAELHYAPRADPHLRSLHRRPAPHDDEDIVKPGRWGHHPYNSPAQPAPTRQGAVTPVMFALHAGNTLPKSPMSKHARSGAGFARTIHYTSMRFCS